MNKNIQSTCAIAALLVASSLLIGCSDKPDALLASAKSYLAKNDTKAAVIQIKNALQVDPDLVEARVMLGRALLDSGDAIGAETEFRKAIALNADQDQVMPLLAVAMLAQGQSSKVISEFSQLELATSEAMASLKTSLAGAYGAQGKAELSDLALKAALLAQQDFAPALIAKARRLASQGDLEGATAVVADVLSRNPNDHEAWKLQGDLTLFGKGLREEALVDYKKAVNLKPDYMAGQASVIATLLQMRKLEDASEQMVQLKKIAAHHPQTNFFEAQIAVQKKDYPAAREFLQQVLKVAPTNVQALQLAGAVEFQLNALVQAENYLGKALRAAPELPLARRLLIMTYLRSGQAPKALETLLPALSTEPVNADIYAVAGEVYLQNGDLETAESYFSKAAQNDPQDGRTQTALAITHLMTGKVDAGFEELERIASSDAGITADLALISANLQRREFGQAMQAIDGLVKKQPNSALPYFLRARTLLATNDTAGARQSFEAALAVNPAYFPAAAGLSSLDVADKKPEMAKKRFEALLVDNPKNPQVRLALAELAALTGAPQAQIGTLLQDAVAKNPTDTASQLALIDFHLRNKEFKAAISSAQNALTVLPERPEVMDALGRAQQAAGDTHQAIISYNKLAGMLPRSTQAQMRLASIYRATKDLGAAEQSLRKAIEIRPDYLDAQRALIALHLDNKKFQDALTVARSVQQQRPKQAVGYVLEGDVAAKQKKWELASAAYRGGLKQVGAPELAMKLHFSLQLTGKTAEAAKFSSQWQQDHPDDVAFLHYLGDQAVAASDFASAEKHYGSVIKRQSSNAVALNNLAWVTARLNKPGAVALAERAVALAPDQAAFMDTLAVLLSDRGDYAEAVKLQTKALSLQPDNPVFQLNLAKMHIKGGQKAQAKALLVVLESLGERFNKQAEVASLMKSL